MKINTTPLIAALALAVSSASAVAGLDSVTWFPNDVTNFEDDDLDFHIDGNNDGILDQGETLVALFELSDTFPTFGLEPKTAIGPDELTGVAAITVVNKVASGALGPNGEILYDFIFGPPTGGLNTYITDANDLADDTGAMVAMWLDSTPDFTPNPPAGCTDLNSCIDVATNGEILFEVDGFAGDPDEIWIATNAFDDLAQVATLPASSKVALVNTALSGLFNGTGQELAPQTCAFCGPGGNNTIGDQGAGAGFGLVGSGDVLGGLGNAAGVGAFGRSDFDFSKVSVVPEPSILAILAAGLVGLGVTNRRRRRQA